MSLEIHENIQLKHFSLLQLKSMFKEIQTEHKLLKYHKIYGINKFDLVCLLENSELFDCNYFDYIKLKINNKKFYLYKKKTYDKGRKCYKIYKEQKMVTLDFS